MQARLQRAPALALHLDGDDEGGKDEGEDDRGEDDDGEGAGGDVEDVEKLLGKDCPEVFELEEEGELEEDAGEEEDGEGE